MRGSGADCSPDPDCSGASPALLTQKALGQGYKRPSVDAHAP